MTTQPRRPHLVIVKDGGSAAAIAADMLAREIAAVSDTVLGLATGRTMESVYEHLVPLLAKRSLSFENVTTFNLDEYVGLSAEDLRSYRQYMIHHLFAHVIADPRRLHVPNGTAEDLNAECAAYEAAIRDSGGVRLQLLGIGETGHIGFNEPPSAFDTRTRVVTLDDGTRRQNAEMFDNDPQAVPGQAITMGVGTILEAHRLLMLATGTAKAAIVAKALEGDISPEVSASAIRLHPATTVVLDEAAAACLSEATRATAERP